MTCIGVGLQVCRTLGKRDAGCAGLIETQKQHYSVHINLQEYTIGDGYQLMEIHMYLYTVGSHSSNICFQYRETKNET